MSTRQGLYYAWCLASSTRQVIKGSYSIASESFCEWANTSTLTRPLLTQFQWYYDPEWEKAKKLSEEIKSKTQQ